jgi:hypothetical protein
MQVPKFVCLKIIVIVLSNSAFCYCASKSFLSDASNFVSCSEIWLALFANQSCRSRIWLCEFMDHYDFFKKVACQLHHEWGGLTAEAVHKKALQPSQRYMFVGKRETESLRLFVRVIILVACVFSCI